MVNFSFFALATALAATSVNAGSSAVKKTIKLGNRNLRRGDPATEALIKKAHPYKKAVANARRLDEVEIDGSYNLKFSQCVDVKTYDRDLFDEDLVSYVEAGQVVSSSSYVLFHVCQGDDCYYEADADLYIVDLPTYLTNVAQYHANKRGDYCEQCERFEDYCAAEEEEEEEEAEEEEGEEGEEEGEEGEEDEEREEDEEEDDKDEEENQEENEEENQEENQEEGEGEDENNEEEGDEAEENNEEGEDADEGEERRKLKKTAKRTKKLTKKQRKNISRKLAKEYIDCDQCQAYECYVDEEDQDDNQQRRDELDEKTSEWIGDLAECKESGVQWNDLDLYLGAMCSPYGDGVELAVFVNEDCTMYTNQKSFYDVYNPYNDDEDGMNYLMYAEEFIKNAFSEVTSCLDKEYDDPDEEGDDDDDANKEYEVNDYCKEVMEGDFANFNNCAANGNNNNDKNEENDDAYNWYTYELYEADDIDEVCYTLNQMEGEYNYAYDEELSGTWYERNKKGQIVAGEENQEFPVALIGVIVGVAVLVLGLAVFLCRPKRKNKDSNEPVYQGGTML